MAHHPAVTAGDHRDDATPEYLARVARILEAGAGRLRGWLSGHDHDLQHVRAAGGLDVFVSGNGARGRPHERFREASAPGAELLFGSVAWGIGVLEASPGGWRYRFEGIDGAPLYCCTANRRRSVRAEPMPVAGSRAEDGPASGHRPAGRRTRTGGRSRTPAPRVPGLRRSRPARYSPAVEAESLARRA